MTNRPIRADDYEASESLARETLLRADELKRFCEKMIQDRETEAVDENSRND